MAQPSGRDRLAGLLGDVRAATAFRYDARDSLDNRMETAKVIANPAGGYLAVYHTGQTCHLATSTDLMHWTHQAVIDQPATQPTIAPQVTAACRPRPSSMTATAGGSASATGRSWRRCWPAARPASSLLLGH